MVNISKSSAVTEQLIKLPFSFTSNGNVNSVASNDSEAWNDRITTVVMTNYGERVWTDKYGANLLLGSFDPEVVASYTVKANIKAAVSKWIPEIEVTDVVTRYDYNLAVLFVEIYYLLPDGAQSVVHLNSEFLYGAFVTKIVGSGGVSNTFFSSFSSSTSTQLGVSAPPGIKAKQAVFYDNGIWTAPMGVTSAHFLVVGEGGASINRHGAGGGEVVQRVLPIIPGADYKITVFADQQNAPTWPPYVWQELSTDDTLTSGYVTQWWSGRPVTVYGPYDVLTGYTPAIFARGGRGTANIYSWSGGIPGTLPGPTYTYVGSVGFGGASVPRQGLSAGQSDFPILINNFLATGTSDNPLITGGGGGAGGPGFLDFNSGADILSSAGFAGGPGVKGFGAGGSGFVNTGGSGNRIPPRGSGNGANAHLMSYATPKEYTRYANVSPGGSGSVTITWWEG